MSAATPRTKISTYSSSLHLHVRLQPNIRWTLLIILTINWRILRPTVVSQKRCLNGWGGVRISGPTSDEADAIKFYRYCELWIVGLALHGNGSRQGEERERKSLANNHLLPSIQYYYNSFYFKSNVEYLLTNRYLQVSRTWSITHPY